VEEEEDSKEEGLKELEAREKLTIEIQK